MVTETFERRFARLEGRVAKLEAELNELIVLMKRETENVSFLYGLEPGLPDNEKEEEELVFPRYPVTGEEEYGLQMYTESDLDSDAEPQTATHRQPVL